MTRVLVFGLIIASFIISLATFVINNQSDLYLEVASNYLISGSNYISLAKIVENSRHQELTIQNDELVNRNKSIDQKIRTVSSLQIFFDSSCDKELKDIHDELVKLQNEIISLK